MVSDVSFSGLKALMDRSERLSAQEGDCMLSFWSDELQCFQISPTLTTKRVSITSTCISLRSMRMNPNHWKNRVSFEATDDTSPHKGKISIQNALKAVMEAEWNDDPFQTQSIVLALTDFRACDRDHPKYLHAVESLLHTCSKLSDHRNQTLSAYLRYQNALALLNVVEKEMVPSSILGSRRIGTALDTANIVAFDELCRQLAFSKSGDSANFDVIVLAYSLLTYWTTANSLFLSSFARGVVPSVNMKLVTAALDVIFAAQHTDGTWRKGEPINKLADPRGSSRDIGNNFVFFFDLVSSLLSAFSTSQPQLLAAYLPNLVRCVEWAETNLQREMLPEAMEENNPRSVGKLVKGWRSNHLGPGGAVAWCTAHVFSALSGFSNLLRSLITTSILLEFNGRAAPRSLESSALASPRGNDGDWQKLLDSDLQVAGMRTTLKTLLLERLLLPQRVKEMEVCSSLRGKNRFGEEAENSDYPPLYSLILFGPPGTAKTTICTSIANYLGWNFLTIDTACFLADGLQNIAARMTYIFNRLTALERTIILFDEIEEFCLDRENPNLGMESRLLTTAMLTQLNDLRRKQSCIFIVATNRLRSFDAAVIRPGRFDMLLFVGTTNIPSRVDRLRLKLRTLPFLSKETEKQVLALFEQFLTDHWAEVRFMTFAENEALVKSMADRLALHHRSGQDAIAYEEMKELTDIIAKTATIQGAVKADYIASEALSRI